MVLRGTLAGAAWLALAGFAPVEPKPLASITVNVAEDGAHVAVKLDRPVSRFAFAPGDVAWGNYADVLTPGLTFKHHVVEAAAPFRAFELRLRPSAEEHDGKYSIYYGLGGGAVLYGPGLAADPALFRTQIRFRTAHGQVRYPAGKRPAQGLVFIGPPSMVSRRDGFVAVTDPAMPAWLAELARADLARAVRLYGDSLGTRLPTPPLLLMKFQEDTRSAYVGDVTPGPVVALRFHGAAWKQSDAQAAVGLHAFILHEAFHFWNGGLARPADGAPTWLHEGGAEYASLVAGSAAGLFDPAEVRRRLAEALNRCRFALQDRGDKGLAEIGFLSNQIRYPCGMVLQWAVDLQIRRSQPGRTILDAWAATIATARRRAEPVYTLGDFLAAARLADAERFEPIALLVSAHGPERWARLADVLNGLGARVGRSVTPTGRRTALIFHLLRQSCNGVEAFGYYGDSGRIRLDSPPGCGVLAGNPVLKSIEGGDPFVLDAATFEAVRRRCAAGEAVTILTADGRTLAAPCGKPLPPPPEDFSVETWLPSS